MCGKLVCSWPHKKLVSRTNLSVIYAHIRDEICVSTYRETDKDEPGKRDDTFVEDGTVCGPEMVIRTTKLQVFSTSLMIIQYQPMHFKTI